MRWKKLSRLRSSARRWWKATRARSGSCSTTSTSSSTSSRGTPAISTASIASGAAPRGPNSPTWRNGAWDLGLGAWAKASTDSLLFTLFEPPCAACRKPLQHPLNGAVCEDCWADLRLAPPLLDTLRGDQGVDWACAVDRYEGRM